MRHFLISSLLVIVLLFAGGHQALAKRVALVIGNDDYQEVVKLQKAGNDAKAMADALKSVGFEVVSAVNLVRREMNFQLQSFYSKLEPGDEALFFYAGHGIEIAGRNYLLPTDIPSAKPGREDFIRSEAIPVDRILRSIRQRSTRVSIMILDACRDNPFPSEGTRSLGGSRGLARMPSPEGTFIMYSAGVGQTALDRLSDDDPHPNSVFTRNLVPLIKKPGVSLTRTARTVRRQVQQLATKVAHNQRPAYYDEVTGDFFFAGNSQQTAAGGQTQAPKPSGGTPSIDREALFWSSVKDSTSPAIINTYLKKFPNGQFAELARLKIAELQAASNPPPSPPEPPKEQEVAVATPPSAPVTPPPAKPQIERVQITPSVWPIGKWPEGITSDGKSLWIAESGVRRVAQMDAQTGRIIKRVKVGRLPVNMVANRSGQVFSLVHTDALVWSHPPRGKGKRLGRLRDYPADMVAEGRYLYILTQPGGSSANTKVVRMDQRTGRSIGSDRLPDGNAAGIAMVGGKVWLVHGQGSAGRISVLEPDSLRLRAVWNVDGFVRSIAANSQGAFVAGGEFNKAGLVIRFNPQTGLEEARQTLPREFIGTLAVFQDNVIAIGSSGTIWVLAAQDLTIRRVIKLNVGAYNPRGIHPTAAALYITNQQGQGSNGTVLAVRKWQPGGGEQQQPDEPPAPSLSLGSWKFDGRISAEQSEGRGVLFSASVDIPSPAGTASFILSCYPNGKQIELAMLGRERFESVAKSAIKAGKGRFGSTDSYIDLVIDGQPYPLKASFFEANGELNLDKGYRANGRIMTGLLRSSEATLNAARDRIAIPLRGSTKAICSALRGCGIVQSHCRAKGQ